MKIAINQATASKRRAQFVAQDAAGLYLTSASLWLFDVWAAKNGAAATQLISSNPIRGSTAATATQSPTSPASTAVGDLVIVYQSSFNTTAPTLTIQSGFTSLQNTQLSDSTTSHTMAVAYKVCSVAGAQTYTAWSASAGTSFAGIVVVKTGYTTLTGATSATANTTTNNTSVASSALTLATKKLVLSFSGWSMSSATVTPVQPAGYTLLDHIAGAAAGEVASSYHINKVNAADTPGTWSGVATSNNNIHLSVALTVTPATQEGIGEVDLTNTPGCFYVQLATADVDTDPTLELVVTNTGSTSDMVRRSIAIEIDPGSALGAGGITRSTFAQDALDLFRDIRRNTAQAGGASTVTLDAGASAVDSFYNQDFIAIVGGTGSGQIRSVTGYVGATKVATVDGAWTTNPDVTSVFEIFGNRGGSATLGAGSITRASFAQDALDLYHDVRRNTAQAGASLTITLDAGASAVDDYYNGMPIYIVGGTGLGQVRTISDYVGSTKIASVSSAWITNPDATTVFSISNQAGGYLADGSIGRNTFAQDGLDLFRDVRRALAQGGTGTTVQLDGLASSVTDFYKDCIVRIVGGLGINQTRRITAYNGTTKAATVDTAWSTNPDNTSTFEIWGERASTATLGAGSISRSSFTQDALDLFKDVRRNTAQSGGSSTIQLDASASSSDDFYKYFDLIIVGGLGIGQARSVTAYTGATKQATVDRPWNVNPDNTSVFELFYNATGNTAASIAAAVVGSSIEGGNTLADMIRLLVSLCGCKVTDFTTGTLVFKSIDGSKTRWTVTTGPTGRLTVLPGDLT